VTDRRTTLGFLIAFAAFIIVMYAALFETRSKFVDQCERTNVVRGSLRDTLLDMQTVSDAAAAASNTTAGERGERETFHDSIETRIDRIEHGVHVDAETAEVACQSAIPPPFPFSIAHGEDGREASDAY
jgi:hypothetical protein